MRRLLLAAVVAFLPLATGASAAEFRVDSGASVDLDTGSLDLDCADLSIAGTLAAGTSGVARARPKALPSTTTATSTAPRSVPAT